MHRLKYLDFDLRIERDGEAYQARVLDSPAGQASHLFELPLTRDRIELIILKLGQARRRAKVRQGQSTELSAAREIGGQLYRAVFADEVRACFRASLAHVRDKDATGLRIRLRLDDVPELAELPWELLVDVAGGQFVAQSVHTPIVRYLELPLGVEPAAVEPPLEVLVMVSSPIDHEPLDVEHERRLLEQAFEQARARGLVNIRYLEKPTLNALQRSLRQRAVHIFHYMGHGGFDEESQEGLLIFEDGQRRSHPVDAHRIATMLHDCRTLRLAVLNACEGARVSRSNPYAGVATTLVRHGVPAVIAMQFEVTDDAALAFADELYTALAEGIPIDAAVAEARKSIYSIPNDIEWGTPVLYMRSANGVIFDVPPSVRAASAVAHEDPPQIAATAEAPADKAAAAETKPAAAKATRRQTKEHSLDILHAKVQQFWIDGVLTHRVPGEMLHVSRQLRPDAIRDPWEGVVSVNVAAAAAQPLAGSRSMLDHYDDATGTLLILGRPGSGKTTALLDLTRALLQRSAGDPSHPVPTVLHLSTWMKGAPSLIDWIEHELSSKYQIPRTLSQRWLRDRRLILLLDGLDELDADERAPCVDAIHQLLEDFGAGGLVVTCRIDEYMTLPERLHVNAAIQLGPLNEAQIERVLSAGGPKLTGLGELLRSDAAMLELARTPFMLDAMSRAYADITLDVMNDGLRSTSARRRHVVARYVDRMLSRQDKADDDVARTALRAGLSWLAQQMRARHRTLFLLEDIQPEWLSGTAQRALYLFLFCTVFGAAAATISVTSFEAMALISADTRAFIDQESWAVWFIAWTVVLMGIAAVDSLRPVATSTVKRVVLGTTLTAALWLAAWSLIEGTVDLPWPLYLSGVLALLVLGAKSVDGRLTHDIRTFAARGPSWGRMARSVAVGAACGGVFGGAFWLLRPAPNIVGGHMGMLAAFVFMGAQVGIVYGGLSNPHVSRRSNPNQGMRITLRNALLACGFSGILAGLSSAAVTWALNPAKASVVPAMGVLLMVAFGLAALLWFGGLDVLKHTLVRLLLWLGGKTPLRYVRFLDVAAELDLLQRVGGGYGFVHALIADYFTEPDAESDAGSDEQTGPVNP